MGKAIATSVENPFGLALTSLNNVCKAVTHFMYGTPERANYTYAFALGLVVLSGMLHMADASSMVCSSDTLASSL